MAVSNQYFKRVKEQVTFFYMSLDLNKMHLFKVVLDSQLVDNE